jgi:SNF family Na+-dependent transporter
VVLAVAGSAVGLGNFLRFPGKAANNGGGAFMLPYVISFLILGIPIAWAEWTMGRLGGRYNQNSGPGSIYALWRRPAANAIGAMTLVIPVLVYMYYVLLEAWCLSYSIQFFSGGFGELFATAKEAAVGVGRADAVTAASGDYFTDHCGLKEHGALLNGRTIWLLMACFVINFIIIYRGVTKGIETFCKYAMPALILCAVIILVRVLMLPGIETGLGFMWNPQWETLASPKVWVEAAGQIFFTLSIGFGLILCYSSYLKKDDDVVLTSLSASSTNEFCEVILGGMIVVPAAFLFLGPTSVQGQSTFGLGFVTVPAIMDFMPGGQLFGGLWFGLLFLAAVTSSLSMLQPAISFLEDGFGLRRRASVAILGVITLIGASPIIYFSRGAVALDHTDFWCNLMMVLAATGQVLIFGWVVGAKRGVEEMNRGGDFKVPRIMPVMLKYVTPTFLIVVLVMWFLLESPGYLNGMNADYKGTEAARGVYEGAIKEREAYAGLDDAAMAGKVSELIGEKGIPKVEGLPPWLAEKASDAEASRQAAANDARIALLVFVGVVLLYLFAVVMTDLASRGRIRRLIEDSEAERSDALGATS